MSKLVFLAALLTSTAAFAQAQLSPQQDILAQQMGRLLLANAQLSAALKSLNEQIEDLKKKCGKPCEEPSKPSAAPTPEKK